MKRETHRECVPHEFQVWFGNVYKVLFYQTKQEWKTKKNTEYEPNSELHSRIRKNRHNP